MPAAATYETDFAILVVVPEAMEAARRIFGPPSRYEHREGQEWRIWEVKAEDGGQLMVVIDDAPDRSNMPAQEATSLMINAWRPRRFLLADIGGGYRGRDGLALGDLVIGSELAYYSLVKEVPGGEVEERSFPIAQPSRGPRKALTSLTERVPDWGKPAESARPEIVGSAQPKILPGQIAAGERLVSDPESLTLKELEDRYPKALAVEMEAVGVGRAVWSAQQQEKFTQFGVLRGISDYLGEPGNQETRDAVKPYAAAVAIAAAHAYIQIHPSEDSVLHQADSKDRPSAPQSGAPEYLKGLREVLATKQERRGPDFRLPLRSTDIRAPTSTAPAGEAAVERGELLDIVEHDKLVVVVGKSGAGKSELLNTLFRQLAVADDPLVVPINLKTGWSRSWAKQMPDQLHGEMLDLSMDAVLNAAEARLSVAELNEFLNQDVQVILLVDALNEVPPGAATKIRETLHQYVRMHPQVRVLATDRRAALDYRELRWTVLDLPVLSPEEVQRVIDAKFGTGTYESQPDARKEVLGIPFFLDRALKQGTVDFTSRADLVERYLREGGLEEDDFIAIGEVALDVLRRGETTLSKTDQQQLGADGLEKLRSGGFVLETEAGLVFSHQLIHQYLAGRHLASHPDLWQPPIMDAITFSTASLDGVGMAIKAIDDDEQRDQFLHLVHDWNWRAAVVALSEARSGDRSVSEATEQAILAMAAEKRFDPVEGTRKRIIGLLKTVDCTIAEEFGALSEEDLHAAIATIDHPEISWWREWKRIFLAREVEDLHSDAMIERVAFDAPLIGWMAANALRRAEASPGVSRVARMIYSTHRNDTWSDAAIRWRIVHTLGAWPSTENAELLYTALTDEDRWCQYGAVRSLVEMAARTPDHELRDRILAELSARWRDLDPEPLSQIGWAPRYTEADGDWPRAVRPLIQAVRDAQQDEELERWNQRMAAFDHYAETHAASAANRSTAQ